MEEEMDMEIVFEAQEIDLDYEFEAARFFDFTREETIYEARGAELWFEFAKSYPPSPFAVKLFQRQDILIENAGTYSKCKFTEDTNTLVQNNTVPECSVGDVNNRECEGMSGVAFTNLWSTHLQKPLQKPMTGFESYKVMEKLNSKTTSKAKPFSRKSTLMKPTASQLAKQNLTTQAGASRFHRHAVLKSEKSTCNSSMVESQAVKRQKLEGGQLRKVGNVNQQTNFIHKLPRKEGTVDGNPVITRPKITIPREPELETAHRAQMIRPKSSMEVKHDLRKFRARPLNRKILEAPSLPLAKKSVPKLPEFQEFHLKTSERAMQHISAVSSTSFRCGDSEKGLHSGASLENRTELFRRPGTTNTSKQGSYEAMRSVKIFSSKGDIGVFRNIKRENTVPMEFKFHAEKRSQHDLPIELFSKLSLTLEVQPHDRSELKSPRTSCTPTKGSKENRSNSLQLEHETSYAAKEKLSIVDGKQIRPGCIQVITPRRSLGIR